MHDTIVESVQNLKHVEKYSMRYFKMVVENCEKGNLV